MKTEIFKQICETRLLVGYLGEKQQSCWWSSSFLSPASKTFLTPIYPKSTALAQYSGVCQAALNIHDEHIGIGTHYHLFRLPGSLERSIRKCLEDKDFFQNISIYFASKSSAIIRLETLGTDTVDQAEGPIAVGDYSDKKLLALINAARQHYINAFKLELKTFPYMRCL